MRTIQVKAAVLAGVMGLGALVAHAPAARADEVASKPKGTIGGALLGAELVVIVESIAGVRNGWAYVAGAAGGAIAGGVGGFFVDDASTDGRLPMYMLAGGLALVIPAVVLTLNATRYQPSEDATEDKTPVNVNPPDPGKVGGSMVIGEPAPTPAAPATTTPAPTPPAPGTPGPPGVRPLPGRPAPALPPTSLLDVRGGSLRMGVPVPTVKPMWSDKEIQRYGLAQGAELRMPVFRATF